MDVSIYIYVFAYDWLSLNSTNCMLQLTIVRIDGRFQDASDGAAHTTRVSPLVCETMHTLVSYMCWFVSFSLSNRGITDDSLRSELKTHFPYLQDLQILEYVFIIMIVATWCIVYVYVLW